MGSDSKTVETNKAVTRRFLEEFKNQHVFAVIDELLETLEHLKIKGKKGKWKGFKAAVKIVGKKEKIEEWRERIGSFRDEFNIHVEVYILSVSMRVGFIA